MTYCHKIKYAQFITHELLILYLHSITVKQMDNKQKKFNVAQDIIDRKLIKYSPLLICRFRFHLVTKIIITFRRARFNQFLILQVRRKNMFNPLKRITLYKFTDLHSEMQGFQVTENGSEKIITVYLGPVKCFKKNDIKRRTK